MVPTEPVVELWQLKLSIANANPAPDDGMACLQGTVSKECLDQIVVGS